LLDLLCTHDDGVVFLADAIVLRCTFARLRRQHATTKDLGAVRGINAVDHHGAVRAHGASLVPVHAHPLPRVGLGHAFSAMLAEETTKGPDEQLESRVAEGIRVRTHTP